MYFEVFQGVRNQWYWRLFADQDKKIAFCSQGYNNKDDALEGIELVKCITQQVPVKELPLIR